MLANRRGFPLVPRALLVAQDTPCPQVLAGQVGPLVEDNGPALRLKQRHGAMFGKASRGPPFEAVEPTFHAALELCPYPVTAGELQISDELGVIDRPDPHDSLELGTGDRGRPEEADLSQLHRQSGDPVRLGAGEPVTHQLERAVEQGSRRGKGAHHTSYMPRTDRMQLRDALKERSVEHHPFRIHRLGAGPRRALGDRVMAPGRGRAGVLRGNLDHRTGECPDSHREQVRPRWLRRDLDLLRRRSQQPSVEPGVTDTDGPDAVHSPTCATTASSNNQTAGRTRTTAGRWSRPPPSSGLVSSARETDRRRPRHGRRKAGTAPPLASGTDQEPGSASSRNGYSGRRSRGERVPT
jgi:hypothetical protein